MRTLIAEDDFTSRLLLEQLLREYGPTESVANGRQAVEAVSQALNLRQPYDLICIDIIMPEMDGQEALQEIRALETKHGKNSGDGAKIVMTTVSRDKADIIKAFRGQCDGYLLKPVGKPALLDCLKELGLRI